MPIRLDMKWQEIKKNMITAKVEPIIRDELSMAGEAISRVMRNHLARRDYTGNLALSVMKEVHTGTNPRVEIGPTAQRGGFQAGAILEHGTGPIPSLPFAPIRKWAEFRGLPAGPIWYKIKTEGVSAHPWLEEVASDPEVQQARRTASRNIGRRIALKILGLGG